MLYRLCPTCGRKVPQGWRCPCQKHRREFNKRQKAREKARQKEYDSERRDKGKAAFYHSRSWKALARAAKIRACGMDEYIMAIKGRAVPGDTAHHIETIDDAPELMLRFDNIIYISAATHSMIHEEYNKSPERKRLMQMKLKAIRGTDC